MAPLGNCTIKQRAIVLSASTNLPFRKSQHFRNFLKEFKEGKYYNVAGWFLHLINLKQQFFSVYTLHLLRELHCLREKNVLYVTVILIIRTVRK